MTTLTTETLTAYFNTTLGRDPIPYKNSEMVHAIRASSLQQDREALEHLLDALEASFVRAIPENKETILKHARELLADLAYFADHDPSYREYSTLGPAKAYAQRAQGRAMSLVQVIFEKRAIALGKVFAEETFS